MTEPRGIGDFKEQENKIAFDSDSGKSKSLQATFWNCGMEVLVHLSQVSL